ncbi:MAG: tRNA (adenosine(37)-N6)-threonylcarbamoyltransferase complex dimerization subunit type 1 TsaB [Candidatus Marinimicrobia bacterium]|nr:tRNA (adenosine(37)-N6)-threonylcarbamoyltransferase complex dimerization subunit type 1 TsaB [Candidatus Neomarinimicrobiota bacterium]
MILALETSSLVCGASLHENGECIAESYLQEARVHAEKLVGLVGQLLEDQTIRVEKLRAVIVSAGPGSFTGLRIGMSFAKGLVYPNKIPLAGVNTMNAYLAATRDTAKDAEQPVWVIRSHRDYIYAAALQDPAGPLEIRYGQIRELKDWFPDCRHIISNEALAELGDSLRVSERPVLPSMIGDYYIRYGNDSAGTDYDSLVLEYGMDYKPKEWKPDTAV